MECAEHDVDVCNPDILSGKHTAGEFQFYHFLKNIRICILNGVSPEPAVYVGCLLMALVMLMIGAFIFQKTQDRFILYI